jgi:hypothetical protein
MDGLGSREEKNKTGIWRGIVGAHDLVQDSIEGNLIYGRSGRRLEGFI